MTARAVRLEILPRAPLPPGEVDQLEAWLFRGFSQRRKQLRNALSAGLGVPPDQAEAWLRQAGIDRQRRAETLSLAEWGRLAVAVES